MSVYGTVVSEMTDLDRLAEACRRAGLEDRMEVYRDRNGVYRSWSHVSHRNENGQVRGRDASLVIHGGVDTTSNLCGDTAFVLEDGKFRAEIDVAHGDAMIKWELIQNWYAMIGAERQAKSMGCTVKFEVDQRTGKISGQVIEGARGLPSRASGRKVSTRPAQGRQQVSGRR